MTSKKNRTNEDRLSNFPEDILTHIISLLQFKSAVRTSVLSKRWRYSWMLVSNLEFDNVTPYESVDKVLEFRKSKVEILRLHFFKWRVPKPTVLKWINEAVRLNVSELDMRFRQVDLPLSLFTCRTLTTFRLKFYLYTEALWECPSLVSLPCLKTLDITVYSSPLENAFKLIHGCPILENLSLDIGRCELEEKYYFEIPTLKRLTLSISHSIGKNNKVFLNVHNLEYLSIREDCLGSLYVMNDMSYLVEAKISCNISNDDLWFEILRGIRRAKCISLIINSRNFSSIKQSSSSLPEFPNVKQMELGGHIVRAWFLVPTFLERCSELEHLVIYEPCADLPGEEPGSVPSCMLSNLKTIKITNFSGNKDILQLLKSMLANSKVLKTLRVTFNPNVRLTRQGSLSQDIPMLSRASKDCQFHFVMKLRHEPTP